MKTKIYLVENCYRDPNKVYIGKTINSRENIHKKTFGENIKYTIIDEIESISHKDWKPLECFWIEQFRQWGYDTQNKNKGGGGPKVGSRSKKSLQQFKQKRKNWNRKGTPQPTSFFNKMLGRKHTQKTKDKISKTHLGNTYKKGYINSKETKLKMSMAHKNIPLSEEHKQSISEAMKGHSKTKEHKQNLSQSVTKSFGRKVLQKDLKGNLIKEWDSGKQASQELGLGYIAINNCCRFNAKDIERKRDKNKLGKYTSFSYIWEYKFKFNK